MIQVQHLRIELAQNQGGSEEAAQRAEELLTLEESLSGSTSTPYLDAAQTAVNVYQSSRKIERVLALHRQIVAIADLTYRPNDAQRGYLRMNAAMAYAMARQFDEAERLANEAIALGQSMRPPRTNEYRAQAEQIQKMKANAPGAAQGRTSVVVTPSGQWLVRDRWLSNAETKPPASPRP